MEQARHFFKEFAYVCAGTYFVVLLATFVSVPYALQAQPGQTVELAGSMPHLS